MFTCLHACMRTCLHALAYMLARLYAFTCLHTPRLYAFTCVHASHFSTTFRSSTFNKTVFYLSIKVLGGLVSRVRSFVRPLHVGSWPRVAIEPREEPEPGSSLNQNRTRTKTERRISRSGGGTFLTRSPRLGRHYNTRAGSAQTPRQSRARGVTSHY